MAPTMMQSSGALVAARSGMKAVHDGTVLSFYGWGACLRRGSSHRAPRRAILCRVRRCRAHRAEAPDDSETRPRRNDEAVRGRHCGLGPLRAHFSSSEVGVCVYDADRSAGSSADNDADGGADSGATAARTIAARRSRPRIACGWQRGRRRARRRGLRSENSVVVLPLQPCFS